MGDIIRVAQVMGKMENGGVESVVMNYYRHIDRSRVQFDFIVDDDSSMPQKNEIEKLGGRVIVVPPYQRINEYIKTTERVFRENEYKIVHSHMNTLSVFPLYAAKRAGVPIRIAHNHSTAGKGEYKKNVLKYMLRPFARVYPTHLAACSKLAGDWLFGKGSVDRGDVTVFNNAIDLDKFRFNESVREEVRRELGVENKFVVGHIGRFCYPKNHEFLIDIFAEVHKKRSDSILLLIGEGGLTDDVKRRAEEKGLTDCVKFLGNRTDVANLYQAMDVFVLPSRYEGLPVVGVEAQAAGLPCILSDEVTSETVMQKTTKVLSLGQGAGAWCEAVLNADGIRNADAPESMGKFDIEKIAKSLEEFYFVLLGE